jgi:hypothetical protein
VLNHPDVKITCRSGDLFHFRQCQKLDVEMPADLDQFGRDDSHSTVVGGKGLVQLGHNTPDGGRSFHKIDKKARVGKIESRLHTCDAATHYHYRADCLRHFSCPYLIEHD